MRKNPFPRFGRKLKIALFAVLFLAVFAGTAISIIVFWRGSDGSTYLSEIVSRTLSSPGNRVTIGRVDGALSSNIVLHNLTMADKDGVWLKLDRAELVWNRAALFGRRLSVEKLDIGQLDILRRPIVERSALHEELNGEDNSEAARGRLPELPVKIVVRDFTLQAARLDQSVLGIAAVLEAKGFAELGNPAEGLRLSLDLWRQDAPGNIALKLAYIPTMQNLSLDIKHEEPEGGLVARLMRLEGLPPVAFNVTGRGELDDFKATMTYRAGEKLGATGTVTIVRDGVGRRLDLNSKARIEALLPQPFALLAAGQTSITGQVIFADDGALTVPDLSMVSDLAKIQIAGSMSQDRTLDFKVTAGAISNENGRTKTTAGEVTHLALDAVVKGTLTAPSITAQFDLAGLKTADGKLDQASVSIKALPLAEAARVANALEQPWQLETQAAFNGFETIDRQWSDAIGSSLTLSFKAVRDEKGLFDVRLFSLATPTVTASYTGTLSTIRANGVLNAAFPDLSVLSGIAQKKLRGAVTATMRLDGAITKNLIADIDLDAQGLFVDVPSVDGLLNGQASLRGRSILSKERISLDNIQFIAPHMTGSLNGFIEKNDADTRLAFQVNDLFKADNRLAGQLIVNGALTGGSTKPDLKLTVSTEQASVLEQPIQKLVLDVTAKDIRDALEATLNLQGDIGNQSLMGKAHLQKLDTEGWVLNNTSFSFGRSTIEAAFKANKGLLDGKLRINAPNLDDLSTLALTKLTGALTADVVLTSAEGKQGSHLKVTGRNILAGATSIKLVDADMTAQDLFQKPRMNGFLKGEDWSLGGKTVESVSLKAVGSNSASSVVVLQAKANGLDVNAQGLLTSTDRIALTMNSLSASRGRNSLVLAKPVTITLANGEIQFPAMVIAANGRSGQISLAGKIGVSADRDSDVTLSLAGVPLSVAALGAPSLDVGGTLEGQAKIIGQITRPHGNYDVTMRGVTAAQIRQAGLPPLDSSVRGQLRGNQTSFDATVKMGRVGQVAINGSIPFDPAGRVDLKVQGQVNAGAVANTALSASGQQVAGNVTLDATIAGTLIRPSVSGQALIANASFADPLRGIRLNNIQGRLVGQGETIVVERFVAQTRNKGSVSITGRIEVDPLRDFPGSFQVEATRAELVSNQLVTAVGNVALTMSGPLLQQPRIAGRIDLTRMDITVPDRLPATVQPLPNARHIDPPQSVRVRLEEIKRAQQRADRSSSFEVNLDLTISAPNQIFIRGQGVDAEMGGEVRLSGSSRTPVAMGGFEMRRGRLTIIGQRLDFTRGRLSFSGDMVPELDLLAQTQAGGVVASVAVTGPANKPAFTLSSSPELPQDEVLSRLLFARSSGSLSPFQALQLAQAVAQLSGTGDLDVFNDARKALGLDGLDIAAGANGGVAVGASRYINDRISVGVRAGANPQDTAATINMDITKRLRLQGEVGATGNTSVGVGAEWEY